MSLIILDASTRAAVAAATNQEAQRAALLAPWAGGDVTVRTFNGATLRDVGTYGPWTLIASAARSAQLGNLIARTGSSTGPATLAVFQAGGTDIFSLSLATSPATADIVLPALSGGVMATARTNFSDPGVGRVTISADPSLPVTGGPAPSLTWTGPSTGTVGVPSANFTATLLNGTVPVVVTPSSVPSGTWAPTSRTLTPGGSPSGTFTLTALSAAVHAASLANDTGIAAPLAVSYTAAAAPPPPPVGDAASFASRSTAPLVVWSHPIEADAEVTQHLMGSGDPQDYGVVPRRQPFDFVSSVEQVCLGAELAAPFTAGSATMQINDSRYWPNPAVSGPFFFMVCEKAPSVGRKNLFRCTARAGRTLTVEYVARGDSAFASTPQSYAVGDYAGHQASREWRRVFAALPSGENGKTTNDQAAGGAVPLRSRLTGNALSVPRDASMWQYGWYGHPSNQALWADWTPWEGASTKTPRGVSQGADARFRLWDGQAFYIQYRAKIQRRFWDFNTLDDPNGTDSYFGRKTFAIQSEYSSLNQIVDSYSPSNRFLIPTTPQNPFGLATYKASRVIGVSDWSRPSARSYQKGSPWDVAPHYANLTTSFLPSTGLATPDGAAAWEHKADEWVTFLWYVRPGRSNVAETEIRVQIARTEDPAYDGTYTTLMDVTDACIVYSGSGDYDFPDGPFAYPEVTTMNALPGFQAFGLMGYFNNTQSVGIPPPKRSYVIRMGQIIFSQAPIAPPLPDAVAPTWPFALPARGTIGKISSNTLNDLTTDPDEEFSFSKVLGAWSSAAVSLIYSGGVVVDFIMWLFGGGHGDTGNDGVYAYRGSTGQFFVALPPSAAVVARDFAPAPTTDTVHGEVIPNRPDSSHTYNNLVGMHSTDPTGVAMVLARGSAVGQGAINTNQGHIFDGLAWDRFGNVGGGSTGPLLQVIIKDTLRQRIVRYPGNGAGTDFYTLDYTDGAANWQSGTQVSGRPVGWSDNFGAFGVHDTVRDLYLALHRGNVYAVPGSNPSAPWTQLNITGLATPDVYGLGMEHRTANDTFVHIDATTTPPTGVYVLTPPASNPLTNAWVRSRIAFAGSTDFANNSAAPQWSDRFRYVPPLDGLIVCPSGSAQAELWRF